MKRSPLNRKTPLKAKTLRGWNSSLRPKSDKQRKLEKRTDALRHAPLELGVLCDCGCQRPATECHELVAGHGYRNECMENPRLLMYLTRDCHELIQGMPYAKQIAIVARAMVRAVNRVKRRQIVSVEKVVLYLEQDE